MPGQQRHQLPETRQPGADPATADNRAVAAGDRDVVMCFGPVNATGHADGCSPLLASAGKPAGSAGDLMEALEARHLTSRSRTRVTGRTTVYVQASTAVSIMGVATCQRLTATLHPARASLISGAPASHPQDHQEHPGSPVRPHRRTTGRREHAAPAGRPR